MDKHEYICEIANTVRQKSSCFKRSVGAVFVNHDYEILATGYNEAPSGFDHCDRYLGNIGTCGDPCERTIHAEMNAIVQAAKRGTALEDSVLYCTYLPCRDCARLLVNLRVSAVWVQELDNNVEGRIILNSAGIDVWKWDHNS